MKRIIITLIVISSFVFVGCFSSFQKIDKDPAPCIDFYNMMVLTTESNGIFSKEGTASYTSLLTLAYKACMDAREKLKSDEKQKLVDAINKLKIENGQLKTKIEVLQSQLKK